jgi:hypothetical protein
MFLYSCRKSVKRFLKLLISKPLQLLKLCMDTTVLQMIFENWGTSSEQTVTPQFEETCTAKATYDILKVCGCCQVQHLLLTFSDDWSPL